MAGKRWGLIILGIVIFVVVVVVGVLGTAAYLLYRQIDVQSVAADSPDQEFAKVLSRFEGQTPFIELPSSGGGTPVVHRDQEKEQPQPLNTIHLLVWQPDERKVVRVDLPFWIARLGGNRPLRLSASRSRLRSDVQLQVTPNEIERHGPGLILDVTDHHGERVVVWVD